MYVPSYFRPTDISAVKSFLEENSFGILINQVNAKLTATHIPLLLEQANGKEYLVGHISKANPQWHTFEALNEVLAVFPGPHAYVSSSWYGQENVPTWNYLAVHVYGQIQIIDGQELYDSLARLVAKYEANNPNPVKMSNLSEKILKQINGVIGFKINIQEIQAAYKLSQNRNSEDHQSIIDRLRQTGDPNAIAVANQMEKKNT